MSDRWLLAKNALASSGGDVSTYLCVKSLGRFGFARATNIRPSLALYANTGFIW
jgi:hypothetical protein